MPNMVKFLQDLSKYCFVLQTLSDALFVRVNVIKSFRADVGAD